MIIVTGSVTASPETNAEMAEDLTFSTMCGDHGTEPGCVMHSVHRDVENHHRFVFWSSGNLGWR